MQQQHLTKSKRADIPTVVLVFIAIIIFGAVIVNFLINSNKEVAKIEDISFIEGIYGLEKEINYYFYNTIENAYIKTYSEVLEFVYTENSGELFIENFKINFNEEIKKYRFPENEKYLQDAFNQVSLKDRKITEENGKIKINLLDKEDNYFITREITEDKKIREWVFPVFSTEYSKDTKIWANHIITSEIEINPKKLTLEPLNEFYNKIKLCEALNKNSKDFENCLNEKIKTFDFKVNEKPTEYNLEVSINSKNNFLINNKLQKISAKINILKIE